MRYHILACDYDGTIALNGRVDDRTVEAMRRLRETGRRLILVTGRELNELLEIFPHIEIFDRVVAENGALLYTPETKHELLLAERPPDAFIERLTERGVAPMSAGKAIVATWHPHEVTVLETIRDMGLELQVIFNKDAVMVLPSGVNKATGLAAALREIGFSRHNTVGVGDAENDHAFLALCECSAAVANALPMVKERADIVLKRDHGEGVQDLIGRIIESDLREIEPELLRHRILLGTDKEGAEVRVPPYGMSLLIAGTSGGGKSTLATGFLERLAEAGYQFCIIDPEGDYTAVENGVILGDHHRPPNSDEIIDILSKPDQNVVVNMTGIALDHRPAYFEELLPHLQKLRAATGHPHWILIDEIHHLLPASWDGTTETMPRELQGILMITVHPEHVSASVLAFADLIVAIGETPAETIRKFGATLGQQVPPMPDGALRHGEAIGWYRNNGDPPFHFTSIPPRGERIRHYRKYAEGELSPELSFYFSGKEGKMNLRAQNFQIFLQIADGVDDETWIHHLRNGDFSEWIRRAIKDEELGDELARIERSRESDPVETRKQVRAAIESRYTKPS